MFPSSSVKNDLPEPKVNGVNVVDVLSGLSDHAADYYQNTLNDDSKMAVLNSMHRELKKAGGIGSNPRTLIQLGDVYVSRGDFKRAIKPYKNAVSLDPSSVEGYRKVIQTLVKLDNYPAAEYYFEALLKLTNYHIDYQYEYLLFKLAEVSDHPQDRNLVVNKFKSLSKNYMDDPKFLNALGVIGLLYENDIKTAQKHFRKVLDLDPDNIHANNNLGATLLRQKKYTEGYRLLRLVVKKYPSYSASYENIAASYMEQKKYSDALKVLEAGLENGLTYSFQWGNNLSWLYYVNQRPEDSIAILQKQIAISPSSGLYNNLGVAQDALDQRAFAIDSYKRAVNFVLREVSPTAKRKQSYNCFYNLLAIYQQESKTDKQEELATLLLSVHPDDSQGLYFLGSAKLVKQKYEGAKKYLERAIEVGTNNPLPYTDLSFYYSCIVRDNDKAIQLLLSAPEHLQTETVFNNLAFAYLKKGELELAEKTLQDEKINHPVTYATKGLIAFYKDDFSSGNRLYKKAISKMEDKLERDHATQIWHYEQAVYWYRNGNSKKALQCLEDSLSYDKKFYAHEDALALKEMIRAT